VPLCRDKVDQLVAMLGIKQFEIFSRVLILAVAQVSGQHRQGMLGGFTLVFDAL
jgi:hypothetical protein